ncbi:MAG TPA: ribosome assembly RNA-binding protein YhbY [Archangium sp.]
MALNGKQRRQLRALGHHLSVVVQVGSDGMTEGVIAAAAQALKDHELIKVKLAGEDREERMAMVEQLAAGTEAEVAQTLGKTVLLYKKRKKNPKIKLVAGE